MGRGGRGRFCRVVLEVLIEDGGRQERSPVVEEGEEEREKVRRRVAVRQVRVRREVAKLQRSKADEIAHAIVGARCR